MANKKEIPAHIEAAIAATKAPGGKSGAKVSGGKGAKIAKVVKVAEEAAKTA
jgi:hypothetical protein